MPSRHKQAIRPILILFIWHKAVWVVWAAWCHLYQGHMPLWRLMRILWWHCLLGCVLFYVSWQCYTYRYCQPFVTSLSSMTERSRKVGDTCRYNIVTIHDTVHIPIDSEYAYRHTHIACLGTWPTKVTKAFCQINISLVFFNVRFNVILILLNCCECVI